MCACVHIVYGATPLWMRNARISPDGEEIAFCYKGNIYKVSSQGGEATQLTTQSSYEGYPVWSPDGRQIAFATDRNGNFDIYIMPSSGGSPRRLTYNSADELPSTFTPDGRYVLFSATIQDPAASALFPSTRMSELYKVPADGGRTAQVLGTPAEDVCFERSGEKFLYQDNKGIENEWRKHQTSSAARDIWLYDGLTDTHTNLTHREGEDRNPVYSPNEETVYFLSERDGGSFNVYSLALSAPENVKPVSHFKKNPVRFLSISDGGLLCYTYDGEIYTQWPGEKPKKVEIDLVSDDEPTITSFNFTHDASSSTVSPDGRQVAFVVRGDIFVTSTDYSTTKQITSTAATETCPSFAPDNRTLVYASERTGNWQLYTAKITRKGEKNFPNATLVKEEVLLPSKTVERQSPQFSPDGKEIAFIEDRKRLMVYNIEKKKTRQITDGTKWYSTVREFSYHWSPDGKWFVLEFISNRHDPYTDIGIVSAQGGDIVNLTNSGYTSSDPQWVMDGNAILFKSDRYGMRAHASWGSQDDAMLVFMNQEAYDHYQLSREDYEMLKEMEEEQDEDEDKEENPDETEQKAQQTDINIEIDGIEDRFVRLTPYSVTMGSIILSKDGDDLYFLSYNSLEDASLWKMNIHEKEPHRLTNIKGLAHMEMDNDGDVYLLGEDMQKLNHKSDKLKKISFVAEMKMNLAEEREAMFNHVYVQEKKCFYDTSMHGVDWDAVTATYRKFLPHVNNNYDFAWLLSEWLGELNVSHTGGRYNPETKNGRRGDMTAHLGLLYDFDYSGEGMKVGEVLDKSPFDQSFSKVAEGCIIEKINGAFITTENDVSLLLNNLAGKKTLVSIFDPETMERWDEVVIPITTQEMNNLLYDRWVKRRAKEVEEWSGGRLGYVHIKAMGDDSFRTVYSDVLGKYNLCDGIVIDTRFNGGGRLHEDVEILFSGEKYLTQVIRGEDACDMPSRRWNKGSIMLMCEANYSNACGTPWVYRYKHIGKLVGMPVPGTMTSVSWERLQDPSLIFGIPIVGYLTAEGTYLENSELQPDILVANPPETIVKGEDTQLRTAVDELLKEVE